jgi:hypothetical protein
VIENPATPVTSSRLKISAKQINMFGQRFLKEGRLGGCPRSYAAWYVDHIRPEVKAPYLVDGVKAHRVTDSLLKTGNMPEPALLEPQVDLTAEDCLPESKYGIWARKALVWMPQNYIVPVWADNVIPRRDWITEAKWSFPWTTGKGVECDIDLRPDACAWAPESMIELVDFKYISDKRYALTSLTDDSQANLYAFGLMYLQDRPWTNAHWIYTVKKPPHSAWSLGCVFKREPTEQWIHDNLDATIELISVVRANGVHWEDLPGDDTACQGRGFLCDMADKCLDLWGPKEPRLITLDEIVRYKNGK